MLTAVPILLGLFAFGVAGCGQPTPTETANDDLGKIANFTLTERNEKPVRLEDLSNKVWVASFIFTRCAGPCSQISGSMARLQHELAGLDDVRLVSFTVDPDHDQPNILRDYATRYGASADRWLFLTGPQEAIYGLIVGSFKLGVERAPESERKAGYEVTHSTKLMLVDRRGHHRGFFEGTDPAAFEQLRARVQALLREKP